jgi:hypothetical protein
MDAKVGLAVILISQLRIQLTFPEQFRHPIDCGKIVHGGLPGEYDFALVAHAALCVCGIYRIAEQAPVVHHWSACPRRAYPKMDFVKARNAKVPAATRTRVVLFALFAHLARYQAASVHINTLYYRYQEITFCTLSFSSMRRSIFLSWWLCRPRQNGLPAWPDCRMSSNTLAFSPWGCAQKVWALSEILPRAFHRLPTNAIASDMAIIAPATIRNLLLFVISY